MFQKLLQSPDRSGYRINVVAREHDAYQIIRFISKMPKLKRASSSLAASQAKKQKRLRVAERFQQDSDDISDGRDRRGREERKRERNTEARQIARLNPL